MLRGTGEIQGPRLNHLRGVAKRLVFSCLRLRLPVHVYDESLARSGTRLRVMHVGDPSRGRYFVERLYGRRLEGKLAGRVSLASLSPERLPIPPGECDVVLVEINRLAAKLYRNAGYFAIPEWVEFGRRVEADRAVRYSGASKSLRTDLRAIERNPFRVSRSFERRDFEYFYDQMYLPHIEARFGIETIVKPRGRLLRDFRSGFLMLLHEAERPIAGGIVRIDGPRVTLTTFGVLNGSDDLLKAHVSGVIDYYLHEWAAENGKRHINVGHTRPFPRDGVFYNKRKWRMSIRPDEDGVTDMALKSVRGDTPALEALADCPFVYTGRLGLGVLTVHQVEHPLELTEALKLLRRDWTEGLSSLIVVCPGGYRSQVVEGVRDRYGTHVHLCVDLGSALRIYQTAV